ncbi:hypothetical protein [Streptomyces nodosus]|uniref:hypothetical protein n=1 Tax=Streptomyces nodosus TaxID=40318 RepID=UPI003814059F
MTTQTAPKHARVFHRAQLEEWGVPFDLPTDPDTVPEGAAVELHSEQVGSRRWVSVHELVFRAPDDGKAYRVTYQQGLTEHQDGTDEWDDRDHVVGEEVEQRPATVTEWRRVEAQPTHEGPDPSHGGLTTHRGTREQCSGPDCGPIEPEQPADDAHPCELCDVVKPSAYALHDHMSNVHPDQFEAWRDRQQPARSALATAVILPHPSDPDDVIVEAASSGISKAVVAYALRQVADQFDTAARAEGDEPIPYTLTEQAEQLAEQQPAPRILTDDEYEATYNAARARLGRWAHHIGRDAIDDAVTATLAAVGILTPPPAPDPDECPAMFADREGMWHQCAEDPDHDPADGHTDGEWSWPHGDQFARPEPDEDDGQAQQPPAAAPSWEARADHAVRLYAQTAIERDDARAEVKRLRAHLADLDRERAEQVEALGKARGWSTWAADYIHPDREFVDTGAPEAAEAQQQ